MSEATEMEQVEPTEQATEEVVIDNYESWDELDEDYGADQTSDVDAKEEFESKEEEAPTEEKEEAPEEPKSQEEKEEKEEEPKALEKKEEEQKEPELIEVKVDGEIQQVTLDELKQNYSGKVAYDKKFTELDKERKEYKAEVEEINQYVNEFGRIAQSGDAVKAMQYLGAFAGIPPYQIKEMMLNQLQQEVYRREQLSEEELAFERSQEQLKYDKEQTESERQRIEREQANTALQREILDVRATHNISQEEWESAVSTLDEILEPHEQITPELVGKFVKADRLDTKAVNLLSEFDNRIEATDDIIENLSNFIENNPQLSDQELKDIITRELDEAEAKEKKDNLEKAKEVKEDKPKAKKKVAKEQKQEESEEILDWDDLEDDFY